jgi:RHS repeat-associated protein
LQRNPARGAAVFSYTYDGRGNKVAEDYTDPLATEHISYGYDNADRLTGTQYPDHAVLYDLLSTGAHKHEKSVSGQVLALNETGYTMAPAGTSNLEYSIDGSGLLTGVKDLISTQTGTIQTDSGGRINRLQMPGGPNRVLTWDPADRLLSATTDGVRTDYHYDFRGWRTHATTGGVTTQFHWGAEDVLEENGPGGVQTYERMGSIVSAVGGQRLLHDGMGSVMGTWDGSQLDRQYRYEPFGKFRSGPSNWTQPTASDATLACAGQHFDPQSGLSYAQQRWYAPELGRFLSEDPLGHDPNRMRELDGFGYGSGNPERRRRISVCPYEPAFAFAAFSISRCRTVVSTSASRLI